MPPDNQFLLVLQGEEDTKRFFLEWKSDDPTKAPEQYPARTGMLKNARL